MRFEKMKIAYFDNNEEMEFEIQIDKLESIDEKFIVKNVPPMNEYDTEVFSNLSEEIFVVRPYNECEDFYLQYLNHSDYYQSDDNNFKIGSLISHTFGRNDKNNNFINLYRDIYKNGTKRGNNEIPIRKR